MDPDFRVGEELKDENAEKNPLILQGPAPQVTSRNIRPRSMRGEHIAPGVVKRSHLEGEFFTTLEEDIEITDVTKGVVLHAANGTRWRIKVDNTGALSTVQVT